MSETTSLPRWVRPALLLLLLAAFALRLHELTRQDIWWDEARNIDVSLRPFLAVATAPELDIHPPVYFWLLHLWGRLAGIAVGDEPGRVAWVARGLSVFAGVAGVALLWALARRAAGWGAGLAAAAIGGAAAFWLAESQEARMYTVGFALLAAAALALLAGLAAEDAADLRARNRRLAAFVLLSTAALLTHYNAVFILAAWYLWWGVRSLLSAERWRRLRTAFVCGLAGLLLALPAAPLALRQIPDYANPNLVVPSLADYLRQNWVAYLGGYAFDPALLGGQGLLWLRAALAVLAGGLAAWLLRGGRGRGLTALSFLLTWLALGLALYYIAVLDRGAFNVRYSSFVTPALYALLGVALAGWARLQPLLAVVAAVALLVGFPAAARADLYDARFAREDVSGLADWLRSAAGPDDVIFVDQKYPFGFYYQRYAVDPAVTPQGREAAPARYLFVDINTVDQRLDEWAANARRVFWVQWFESDTDPRRAVAFLLDKAGARQGEQSFQGYSVDWWELAPPTHFELAAGFAPAQHRWPPAVQTVELALPDAPVAAGDSIFAAIRWQRAAPEATGRDLKARLALYDAAGSRIAQSDERILNDRHVMPDEWSMDDRPLNVYRLDTPPDLAPGPYTLGLLVYDAGTLEPLPLVDAAGAPVGQEATVGTVEIAAPQASGAQK